jgi:hypothetical protein
LKSDDVASAAMKLRFAKLTALWLANASSLIVVVALVMLTGAMVLRVAWDSNLAAPPKIGSLLDPKFSLIDQNGKPFTNASFEANHVC